MIYFSLPGKPGLPRSPLRPACTLICKKQIFSYQQKEYCFLTSAKAGSPFGPGTPGKPLLPGKPIN
jgi:hypothetical protein